MTHAKAYYNENNKKAAAWLRELIAQNLIAPGDVDERSIAEVQPADLVGFTQCHFFAGIGGWPLAFRLAGWPDSEPAWSGSCPCQPFSCAGNQLAQADPRHLWPVWFRLIQRRERRSVPIFGEQVEAAVRLGWLDGISADLETEDYACGAVVLGAHSVNAPHIRQRLFWVAHPHGSLVPCLPPAGLQSLHEEMPGPRRLADTSRGGFRELRRTQEQGSGGHLNLSRPAGGLAGRPGPSGSGRLGDAIGARLEGHAGHGHHWHEPGWLDTLTVGSTPEAGHPGYWDAFELVACKDGKARRIEPGTFPLVDGFPARVDLLRGYGNAIVPQVAAEFILGYQSSINPTTATTAKP